MRRHQWSWIPWLSTAAVALLPVMAWGQSSTSRDSTRVYRLQVRGGDGEYARTLRTARQQLEERLDSLQREFEGLGLDAPDRVGLSRQLRTLISSLDDLRQLEQEISARVSESTARSLQRAQLRAGELGARQSMVGVARLRASMASLQPGWIGINAEAPHTRLIVRNDSAYIRYLSYPEVVSVEPNSPAERVGISRGDQLIAYDGADLRDREINLTRLLQPARKLRVTVRRDGEEREFPVIVGKPPLQVMERRLLSVPAGAFDGLPERVVVLPPSAPGGVGGGTVLFKRLDPESAPLAGAQLVWIHGDAWESIFDVGSGVLVTDVFSDPARASGLKVGDVILRADGQDLTSVAQLRRIVDTHRSDRVVELQMVRQKRARTITLHW